MHPVAVAKKYVELARQTGRSTELIKSLPDEKCAIMTISYADHDNLKALLTQHRPDYNQDNITWLVYSPTEGWRNKTLFRDMHLYLDNSVLDQISIWQVDSINQVYGK